LILGLIGFEDAYASHTQKYTGTDGHCDLSLNFPGPGKDYSNCDLSAAFFHIFNFDFTGSDFSFTDLDNSRFDGSTFTNSDFTGARFSTGTSFDMVIAINTDFSETRIRTTGNTPFGVGTDFTGSNFTGADMIFVKFASNSIYTNTIFTNADLAFAFLTNVNLSNIDFTNADFSSAAISGVDFSGSDFTGADFAVSPASSSVTQISNTNFSFADLTNADFARASITNVDLTGASLGCLNHPICESGDLELIGAEMIQAPMGTLIPDFILNPEPVTLVEEKPTILGLRIKSDFPNRQLVDVRVEYINTENGVFDIFTREVEISMPGHLAFVPEEFYLFQDSPIIPVDSGFGFRVIIDPENKIAETNETNNKQLVFTSVKTKETKPIKILFRPFRNAFENIVPTCQDVNQLKQSTQEFIEAAFPIVPGKSNFTVSCQPWLVVSPQKISNFAYKFVLWSAEISGKLAGWDKVVLQADELWIRDHTFPQNTDAIAFTFAGTDALIIEKPFGSDIVAHEIGHTYGWVAEDHPYCCEEDRPFHFNAKIFGDVPAPGFWVEKNLVFDNNYKDLMKDLSPVQLIWISKDTFMFLIDKLKVDPDPPVILFSGIIAKNNTAVFNPWYRYDSILDIQLNNPGEYSVVYLDGNEQVLAQTGFDLSFLPIIGSEPVFPIVEDDEAPFAIRIPDVPGTAKMLIKKGIVTLGERVISSNAPTIQILSPNGGEQFLTGDTINVSWAAADSDGDDLFYTVFLSDDNGNTLVPLDLDLTVTNYSFEAPLLINSTEVIVKVIATDGINTGTDQSDSSFSILSDIDGDGVVDTLDNCPNDANPGQEDIDGDGIGDACDTENLITSSTTITTSHTLVGKLVVPNGVIVIIPSGLSITLTLS